MNPRTRGLKPREYRTRVRAMIDLIENHEPAAGTFFRMIRQRDESGTSLTLCDNDANVVLEGCVFTGGSVAVRWRSTYWSMVFYPDWKSFVNIHIGSHPTNGTILEFDYPNGDLWTWRQEDEQRAMQSDAQALVNAIRSGDGGE